MILKNKAKDFSLNLKEHSWKFKSNLSSLNTEELDFTKYVYTPCNIELNQLESDFAQFLEETSTDMLWWYKNSNQSDQEEIFIQHEDFKLSPDFMVMMEDNFLGLFILDQNQRNLKDMAKILQKFITTYNSRYKLFGGIITKCNDSFWISDSSEYEELQESEMLEENIERTWYKLKIYLKDLND